MYRSGITKPHCSLLAWTGCLLALLGSSSFAAQDPVGCSANNLNVNIGVRANNVTNGTVVTWFVTVQNPNLPTSCAVTLGPEGLYFICPGPDGNPTGTRTTLIPGGTKIDPGYGPQQFDIPCLVNVSGLTAEAKVAAPGSVVHKNPLQDDPANVDKTISVNVFRPCLQLATTCVSAVNASGTSVTVTYNGTLTNCGNVLLQNVMVYADQPGAGTLVFGPITMAAGARTNFTASYTRTDNLCGPFVTVLSASGTAPLDTPVLVTANASSQCTISYNPSIRVTASCPASPVQPGQLLTISGVVSNSGNIALTNVVVVNTKPQANNVLLGPITLAVGQAVSYTGSYSVPSDSCPPYADSVTAQGNSICGLTPVSNQAALSCPGTNSPSLVVTALCPPSPVPPGGRLEYSGTLTNTGNVTLNNVTVVSDKPNPNTRIFGPASLAPGAGVVFNGSYTVPADGCGPHVSTLVASGSDKCFSRSVSSSARLECPGTATPGIRVSKTCPTSPVQPGGTLSYSGTVTNIGDITLTNVTVYNGTTLVYGPGTLAPRARATFTGSYTVPLDSCGPYVDTLIAQGSSVCGSTVVDSVTVACPGTNTPSIRITKSCPGSPVPPGGLLTYTGAITNTGNITLTNIIVVNSMPAPNTVVFGPASLAPGAGVTFTGSYTVPLDSCGPYSDTLTVSGADKCFGKVVSASARSDCPGVSTPGISITQNCPPSATPIGSNLVYSATVLNTGNITLTNIAVVSDRPSANTTVFRAASLAPGQSTNFTATFVVPATHDACTITSSLTATGRDKCTGTTVTANTSATCPVSPSPAISVTKNCPTTAVSPGGTLAFTGTVRNGGNVTLSNIVVTVNRPAEGTVIYSAPSLAPGASANFTGSYATPLDDCSVTDTVSVTALDRCGNQVSNSTTTTCPLTTAPAVAIGQICPDAAIPPGGEMPLLGWVTNTGNVTLTNVTVVVDRPVANTPVFGPVTLAPGQVASFAGSYTVPTNTGSCTISSTLTARGNGKCGGNPVTASATQSCPLLTSPKIIVTQSCPPNPVAPGSLLTFSGTVFNAGDSTLTNIVVVNDVPVSNTVVFAARTLAPGQMTNFTGSYVAPTNCCSVCSTLTASAQNQCTGARVTDSATALCPVLFTPAIRITKTCPTQAVMVGESLAYSGTISNSGNITLADVVVYNSITGPQNPIFALAALAPGEAWPFKGSFTVPADFCEPDTVTVTAMSICGEVAVTNAASSACPAITTPGISLVGVTNLQPVIPGEPATFAGTVVNIGNVTLNNVTVVNSMPAPNTTVLGPVTLAPGQSTNFTHTYRVPWNCNCCQVVNTFSATGRDRCASRQVSTTHTLVSKFLTHASLTVALECPTGATAGQSVSVSGTVMNTSDITVTNVVVTDGTKALAGPITLAVGEMQDFTATYTVGRLLRVTASGVNSCTGSTVFGEDSCGQPIVPPVFSAPVLEGENLKLTWSSVAGVTYRLQYCTNMLSPAWMDEPGDVVATGSTASKSVKPSADTRTHYYRVVALGQ